MAPYADAQSGAGRDMRLETGHRWFPLLAGFRRSLRTKRTWRRRSDRHVEKLGQAPRAYVSLGFAGPCSEPVPFSTACTVQTKKCGQTVTQPAPITKISSAGAAPKALARSKPAEAVSTEGRGQPATHRSPPIGRHATTFLLFNLRARRRYLPSPLRSPMQRVLSKQDISRRQRTGGACSGSAMDGNRMTFSCW